MGADLLEAILVLKAAKVPSDKKEFTQEELKRLKTAYYRTNHPDAAGNNAGADDDADDDAVIIE